MVKVGLWRSYQNKQLLGTRSMYVCKSRSAYSDCEARLNAFWRWNHVGSKRRCLLSTKKLHLHQMFMSSFLPWQYESEYYFLFLDVVSTIVYSYLPCLLWTQFVVCHSEAEFFLGTQFVACHSEAESFLGVSCTCVFLLYILKSKLRILKGFGHHFDIKNKDLDYLI